MQEKTKEETVQELKKTLLNYIELQEQLRGTYTKILRRVSIIYISLAVIAISMMSLVIYLLTRPAPASEIALKSIEDWNKVIITQRKFNQYDREDAARARDQLTHIIKVQDSILKLK